MLCSNHVAATITQLTRGSKKANLRRTAAVSKKDNQTVCTPCGPTRAPDELRPFAEPSLLLPGENLRDYEVLRQVDCGRHSAAEAVKRGQPTFRKSEIDTFEGRSNGRGCSNCFESRHFVMNTRYIACESAATTVPLPIRQFGASNHIITGD